MIKLKSVGRRPLSTTARSCESRWSTVGWLSVPRRKKSCHQLHCKSFSTETREIGTLERQTKCFTPLLVQVHLDSVTRLSKRIEQAEGRYPMKVFFDDADSTMLRDPDIQTGLQGIESVLGVRTEDAQNTLLRFLPYPTGHIYEKILSWKDIQKGRDLFYKNEGGFDIKAVYEKYLRKQLVLFKTPFLRIFKAPYLKKKCKEIGLKNPGKVSENMESLTNSTDIDLVEMLFDSKENQKSIGYCNTVPPFPPFVTNEYTKRISEGDLRAYLWSGVVPVNDRARYRQVPFWLVSVAELKVLGYFE